MNTTTALALAGATGILSTAVCGDVINVPGDEPTIQAAIDAAVDNDQIIVAPGTYNEALNLLGKQITLASSGGAAATVLDGAGLGVSIVTCRSGESLQTVIEGFRLTNGEGTSALECGFGGTRGGAIYVFASGLTVIDCVFDQNTAGRGGGIYSCDSELSVTGTSFESNDAAHGGAIGGSYPQGGSEVQINGTAFLTNDASHGGAIRIGNSLGAAVTVSIAECTFTGNTAAHGGGIRLDASPPNASFEIADCTFTGNVSSFGGGMNINTAGSGATYDVRNCVFDSNVSSFGGGIMGYTNGGTIKVTNCAMTNNEANDCCDTGLYTDPCFQDGGVSGRFWGGGADLRAYSGLIQLVNCLFQGNDAVWAGGAHLVTCGGGEIEMINCTATENAPSGVHLRLGEVSEQGGAIEVSNSVVWGNNAEQIPVVVEGESNLAVAFSAVQGGFAGAGNIDVDPGFDDPGSGSFRLGAGSPCIDAGDNLAVPAGVTTDLDGNERFVDDPLTADSGMGPPPLVDMGAYEFQVSACPWDCGVVDGNVSIEDFLALIGQWGGPGSCDLDGGGVGITDFLKLLANWGTCP